MGYGDPTVAGGACGFQVQIVGSVASIYSQPEYGRANNDGDQFRKFHIGPIIGKLFSLNVIPGLLERS